jgi:hypothetical protein
MANLPPPPPVSEAHAAAAPAMMRGRIAFASVQLGAFPTHDAAEQVRRTYGARALVRIARPLRVQAATVNGRQWFRLVSGPFPAADAQGLCRDLSSQGQACLVRPEGRDAAAPMAVAARASHHRTTTRAITLARARVVAPRPLSSESYAGAGN